MTPAERVRFWKDRAEECWRRGDRKGFAECEAELEAWRMWQAMTAEEQEALLRKKENAA